MRWGGWLGKGGRRTMFFVLLPCIFNHKMIILDDCTPPRRGGVQASSIIIMREQKASAFLDSVGIRTGLDEVLLVSPILL